MRESFKRDPHSHKGNYGHLLIVAGSNAMSGASYLSSYSALRSGVGKCTLATTEKCADIVSNALPEIMTLRLKANRHGAIAGSELIRIQSFLKKTKLTAMAIGPGLSRNSDTLEMASELILKGSVPMVIDADATRIFRSMDRRRLAKGLRVVTPHEGEFAYMIESQPETVKKMRKQVAKKFTNDYHCYLVLKGFRSLVVRPDGKVHENRTGNPALATPGSGDCLTGLVASLVAQEFDFEQAIRLGVLIHGQSGDRLAKRFGQNGVLASDIAAEIPQIIKEMEKFKKIPRSLF